jgi:hypothetical protein
MDQEIVKQRLAEAERHVVNGRKHIERQKHIIQRHILEGVDAADAKELLAILRQSQVLHELHRDRLRRELGLA